MKSAPTLYRQARSALHTRIDRSMLAVLLVQWALAVAIASTLSPYSWVGQVSAVHLHVSAALFLGGALNALPILLIAARPGWWLTRHVIAASQMLWSGLLIHLTGGRIETHFHIFGSLAFLALYRDWRVLITATVVVSLDHLLRGLFLPESIYGVINPEWWRFLEHSFWVVFEDVVLLLGCRRAEREMHGIADREAKLEELNLTLEARVSERTEELAQTNLQLQESLDQQHATQRQLVDTSRRAGMADAATAVLHNVGNVLNSVNVSASLARDGISRSKSASLGKLAQLLADHQHELAHFLTADERGCRLPEYLTALARTVEGERETILGELTLLGKNLDHIKAIVGMQQAYAMGGGHYEELSVNDLISDALELNAAAWTRDDIEVRRELADLPRVSIDRHKVFQVLTNLLSNAGQAIDANGDSERRITVRSRREDGQLCIEVADTGVGIREQDRDRIFTLGFTTRKSGHGLGLHASACAALEMKGKLKVRSDGAGHGATFTLTLPA